MSKSLIKEALDLSNDDDDFSNKKSSRKPLSFNYM